MEPQPQPTTAEAKPADAAKSKDKTPAGEKTKHGTGSKRNRNAKKGMIETEPVVGTRDFYPEDMRLRNWLFGHFREVARQFCFSVRKFYLC